MSKEGITFEALMTLDEKEIQATFPLGAKEDKGRFRPAQEGEEDVRPLKALIRDKRRRQEEVRIPARNSARGYVTSSYMALGVKKDQGPTQDDPPEPEAVDRATQDRFTEEAKERNQLRRKSLADRVAALEGKARRDQLASIDKRVTAVERAVHEKAA